MACTVVYKIRRQRTFMLTAAPTALDAAIVDYKSRLLAEWIGHDPPPPRPKAELPPVEWVIARYERPPWMFGRVVAKWPA